MLDMFGDFYEHILNKTLKKYTKYFSETLC